MKRRDGHSWYRKAEDLAFGVIDDRQERTHDQRAVPPNMDAGQMWLVASHVLRSASDGELSQMHQPYVGMRTDIDDTEASVSGKLDNTGITMACRT